MKILKIGAFVAAFSVLAIGGFKVVNAQSMTTAQLQAEIANLTAQLQQLEAQLQAQGGSGAWCYTFNTNLRIGMAGSDVSALQEALQKDGERVSQTGAFDDQTASAVTGFQQKYASAILAPYGLQNGTGYAGKATRAELNSLYGCNVTPVPIATPMPLPTPPPTTPVPTPISNQLSFSIARSAASVGVLTNSTGSLLDSYYLSAPAGTAFTLNTITLNVGNQVTTGGLSVVNLRVYLANQNQWFGATQTGVYPNQAYTYSGSVSVSAGTTEQIEIFGDTVAAVPATYTSPFSIGIGTTGVTASGGTITSTGSTAGANIFVEAPTTPSNPTSGNTVSVSPTSLNFTGTAGSTSPSTQNITFTASVYSTPFTVSIPSNASWLRTITQGTSNAVLGVSASAANLSAGTYTTTLGFSSPTNQFSPITVPVTFTVQPSVASQSSFTASQTTVNSGGNITLSWNFPTPSSNSVTDITVDCATGLSIYDVTNGQSFGCGDLVHAISTSGSDVLQFTNSTNTPISTTAAIDDGNYPPLPSISITVNPPAGGSSSGQPSASVLINGSHNPISVNSGAQVTIILATQNVTQCTENGSWSSNGWVNTLTSPQTVTVPTVTATTTFYYGITCGTDVGYVVSDNVQVIDSPLPQVQAQSPLSVTASGLGVTTGRSKTVVDNLGTITFSASPSANQTLDMLTISLSPNVVLGSSFFNGVKLIDANGNDVTAVGEANVSTNQMVGGSCGGGTCWKSWTFSPSFIIVGGSSYSFALRVDDTQVPPQAGLTETLEANINSFGYGALGNTGMGTIVQPNPPTVINNVSFVAGQ